MGGLLSREDVIVVASVSCIYGLGSLEDYEGMLLPFKSTILPGNLSGTALPPAPRSWTPL